MKLQLVLLLLLVSFDRSALAKPKDITSEDLSKETLMIELTGRDIKKFTEEELYADVVNAFRASNRVILKSRTQMFLKKYPKSHFADNVLFLTGQKALQDKNYPEALRSFQKIGKYYPHSNKAVAAQYSKGLTYKHLKLGAEAKRVFKEVLVKYPGSPESFRAEAELKLLN